MPLGSASGLGTQQWVVMIADPAGLLGSSHTSLATYIRSAALVLDCESVGYLALTTTVTTADLRCCLASHTSLADALFISLLKNCVLRSLQGPRES